MPSLSRLLLCPLLCLAACRPAPAAPPAEVSWLPAVNLAAGGAGKGPWRQNDSDYDYVDDGTVAFLPDGSLALAWADQRARDVRLQLRGPDGAARGLPRDVSRSPATFSWHPRLAVLAPATVYVVWQEIIFSGGSHGGDILFARSDNAGKDFSPPLNLSASRGGDGKGRLDRDTWSNGSLDLAVGLDGMLYVAWTEYDGALWLVRSADRGRSFSPPRHVAGDQHRPARAPALAVDRDARVHLAWTVGQAPDAHIHVARSGDGGASFGTLARVGRAGARADAPRIAFDRAGWLHLVFADTPRRPGLPAIRHACAAPGTLRFGAAQRVSKAGQAASYPHLAAGDHGEMHLAWEAGIVPRGLLHAVIHRHVVTRPAPVPHSADSNGGRNGSEQGLLGKKLAAGPDGRLALVNSSRVPGRGSRVWLVPGHYAPRRR